MIQLLPEQVQALHQLKETCGEAHVDTVIIGATAYRAWIDDDRTTQDVDVAVALDVDQLTLLTDRLAAQGWTQDPRREERWLTRNGARVDLLPVGARARKIGYLTWPKAETRMRVVGFDHVFAEALEVELAPGLSMKVAPLPVLALIKAVSYIDDRHGRVKDLQDIRRLMSRYEAEGDCRFSDEVFEAGLDFDSAGAFLLGVDLGNICTTDEAEIVDRLIAVLQDEDGAGQDTRLTGSSVGALLADRSRVAAFAPGVLNWDARKKMKLSAGTKLLNLLCVSECLHSEIAFVQLTPGG